jgi:YD repeat-containing protein
MRAFLALLGLLVLSSLAHAQQVKYFRLAAYDGQHRYRFRSNIPNTDTARTNGYRVYYDAQGRVTRWEYRRGGVLASDPNFNIAGARVTYDGGFEKHEYLDQKGRPTSGEGGDYAEKFKIEPGAKSAVNFQYDNLGRLLTEDNSGCSRYLWMLDKEGRHISEFCLDQQGNKITNSNGVYERRFQYDAKGRFKEFSMLQQNGKPTEALSRVEFINDADGNIAEIRYYDSIGLIKQGAAVRKFQYSKEGLETRNESLTGEGLLIEINEADYDRYGNRIETRSYGADGEILSDYGITKITYNELNLPVLAAYHSRSGELTYSSRNSYGDDGRWLESKSFNGKGEPAINAGGYSSATYTYDARGNLEYESYLDTEGLPINSDEGYAYKFWKWNDNDQVTDIAYYNVKKELVMPKTESKAAALRFVYNDKGQHIETIYFDVDGEVFEPSAETTSAPAPVGR